MKKYTPLNTERGTANLTHDVSPLQLFTKSSAGWSKCQKEGHQQDHPEWIQAFDLTIRQGLMVSGYSETEAAQVSDLAIRGYRAWVESNVVGKVADMLIESLSGLVGDDYVPALPEVSGNSEANPNTEASEACTDLGKLHSTLFNWSCENALDELFVSIQAGMGLANGHQRRTVQWTEQLDRIERVIDDLVEENEALRAQISFGAVAE